MKSLPPIDSRSYKAKTLRVIPVRKVEALVDLDFGVQVQKTFIIDGLDDNLGVDGEQAWSAARHCMIVLLGGKKLVVRPDPEVRHAWHRLDAIKANVYVLGTFDDHPVGYVERLPEANGPALEVGPFITWLSSQNFDVARVKEALNGVQ